MNETEKYGARLLEQNVRSILQFTEKINNSIRDIIRNEPHMLLAFNDYNIGELRQVVVPYLHPFVD